MAELYDVRAVSIAFGVYWRRGIGAAPKCVLQNRQKSLWTRPSRVLRVPALRPTCPQRGQTDAGDVGSFVLRTRLRVLRVWRAGRVGPGLFVGCVDEVTAGMSSRRLDSIERLAFGIHRTRPAENWKWTTEAAGLSEPSNVRSVGARNSGETRRNIYAGSFAMWPKLLVIGGVENVSW